MTKSPSIPDKQIVLIGMIYMSLFLASSTLGYKIVAVGSQLYCASILIFPLLFPFSDALTEIYGTKFAKSMIWYTIICECIFVTLTNSAIRLPSPANWHHQAEYDFIVGGYAHILLANVTAMLVSFYLNVWLLNKWKVLLKGKHYYFRSLGATAIGELIYTIITNAIAYTGVLPAADIINIIFSNYLFKLIYSAILAYPAALFVIYIKSKYKPTANSAELNPFKDSRAQKVVDISKYIKNRFSIKGVQEADKSTS